MAEKPMSDRRKFIEFLKRFKKALEDFVSKINRKEINSLELNSVLDFVGATNEQKVIIATEIVSSPNNGPNIPSAVNHNLLQEESGTPLTKSHRHFSPSNNNINSNGINNNYQDAA